MRKKQKYQSYTSEYKNLFVNIKVKEDSEFKRYKDLLSKLDGTKKTQTELDAQKDLNEIFKAKMDIIDKGIVLTTKYHSNVLLFEEISFDNAVMTRRANLNFERLNKILY
jgi:hypothetical protein